MKLPTQLLSDTAQLPTRAHDTDAGLDLYSAVTIDLLPMRVTSVDIGVAIALPPNTFGRILGRSSLAQIGIFPIGGVVDEGYIGNYRIILANLSDMMYTIKQGDRIAQLVICPVVYAEPEEMELNVSSSRGTKGFGSSGQ